MRDASFLHGSTVLAFALAALLGACAPRQDNRAAAPAPDDGRAFREYAPPPAEGDCNGNGVDDAEDLAPSGFGFSDEGLGVSFGPFPAPRQVIDLAIADLDGNRWPDIVTLLAADPDGNGLVRVFRDMGLNDGRPEAERVLDATVAEAGRCLAVADFNGGGPDVAVLATDLSVRLLRNDGAGGFLPETRISLTAPTVDSAYCLTAADLDGDGDADLALSGLYDPPDPGILGLRAAALLVENTGAGFAEPVVAPAGFSSTPTDILAATVDGDDIPDLILASSSLLRVAIQHGEPDPWGAEYRSTLGVDALGFARGSTAVGDIDGDGWGDVVNTANGSEVMVLRNAARYSQVSAYADGFFERPEIYADEGEILGCTAMSVGVALADLDRDGDLDIVTADNCRRSVAVRLNDGTGTFADADYYSYVAPEPRHIAVSPPGWRRDAIFADAYPDIVIAGDRQSEDESLVGVLYNTTQPPESEDCNFNGRPDSCDLRDGTARDRNGNGRPDTCDIVLPANHLRDLLAGRE
jgi:hypothetical protein